MIDPIWLILFGLGFDVVGAFLIVEPILTRFVRINHNKEKGAPTSDFRDKAQSDPNYERKSAVQAWFGFGLLAFGFILQMIGNWIQNPPSF